MIAMDTLKDQVETLWKDFRDKKQTADEAKIHHGYARIVIEASRVEIAERKLRLLNAVPVNQAPSSSPVIEGNSRKRIARRA